MSSDRLQAVSEILGKLDRYSSEQRELHWGGTFADYLEKVVEKPQLVRLSHRYLFDAITSRPKFLDRYSSEQRELHWGGTFADYLEKVVEKPQLVRLSHRYLFDAITSRPNF